MNEHVENIYIHNQFHGTRFLILSGPSAGGKTFLSKKLASFTDKVGLLIKHTDRLPRVGEVNGKDYYFVSTDTFKKLITSEAAMLSVWRYEHLYGLSCEEVERAVKINKTPVFILDPHAAIKFKEIYANSTLVFVGPPINTARDRLLERQEDYEEKKKRIALIESEYSLIDGFDYILNNHYSDNDLNILIDIIVKGEN